jgi:hypothetical protein
LESQQVGTHGVIAIKNIFCHHYRGVARSSHKHIIVKLGEQKFPWKVQEHFVAVAGELQELHHSCIITNLGAQQTPRNF